MEKILEIFDKLNEKVEKIEEALVVLPHKYKNLDERKELGEYQKKVECLSGTIKENLTIHNEIIKKEYEDTKKTIDRVNMKMMFLLEHFTEQNKECDVPLRAEKTVAGGFEKFHSEINLEDSEKASSSKMVSTSNRMTVSAYSRSPHANLMKIKLQFSDFEVDITEEDFSKIPTYMRGRSSLQDLLNFVDHVIIRAFNEKYQLLYHKRNALNPSELSIQKTFREQSRLFEGQKFVTQDDILQVRGIKTMDRKDDKFLQMLRHLQIIREARKNHIIAYIWLK